MFFLLLILISVFFFGFSIYKYFKTKSKVFFILPIFLVLYSFYNSLGVIRAMQALLESGTVSATQVSIGITRNDFLIALILYSSILLLSFLLYSRNKNK